jgi:peptide-methionine (S)-S-oxide reductase
VVNAQVGYAGGKLANPTYADVCTDRTGHAEVVEVEYDPSVVTYGKLLEVFWGVHDPTTPNRQGRDVGTQYRSLIFFHTPEQEKLARESKAKLEATRRFRAKIVTEIAPAPAFWRAEEHHQRYYERHGVVGCSVKK